MHSDVFVLYTVFELYLMFVLPVSAVQVSFNKCFLLQSAEYIPKFKIVLNLCLGAFRAD